MLAPAKLNAGLRVIDRRPDGYHEIETGFVPLELYDRLWIEQRGEPGITLEVEGDVLPADESNLAVRGARAAHRALGLSGGLRLRLEKRIPIGAGLGGGSSDAAAALLGVERIAGGAPLRESLRAELALALGADVPFFLDPRPAVGRGVGERLEPIPDVPSLAWVLVVQALPLSTAEVFAAASRELTLPRGRPSIGALLGPSGVVGEPENDLEPFAARRRPEIREAHQALRSAGARLTGMSGSGPTVWGLFGNLQSAEEACREIELPGGARALAVRSAGSDSPRWDPERGWGVAKR